MSTNLAERGDFACTAFCPRDTSQAVALIGFKRQGNLGLGYLASTLRARGYRVDILDFEEEFETVLARIKAIDPVIVGFSLIFQFYVFRFEELARRLRAHGVTAHFTMGGHFPSLSPQHALELVPELDSVVRFEGELTLLELADRLTTGREWRSVQGIAYREDGKLVATPLRPLIHDLDEYPYPEREIQPYVILGRAVTQMLASRGCARTCSFCSIHMFYRSAPGKVVRTRRPAEIVREMKELHLSQGATIFLFQDDDFPVFGPAWHRWAREFIAELYSQEIAGRVIWKVNARADAIDPELFAEMRDAGMYLVYMGLESGSEEGLITLNKTITVQQNLRAVQELKKLGLLFDFGFMLLDPSSTFDSVLENIAFLRKIVGDGYMAAEFCRMIPYDGTPIKDELERQGRLRGDVCNPDYDFLDPRLYDFYIAVNEMLNLTGWIHGLRALSPQLKSAWAEIAVIERLFPRVPDLPVYRSRLQDITRRSNEVLFAVVEGLAHAFMEGSKPAYSKERLQEQCEQFLDELLQQRDAFVFSRKMFFFQELGIAESLTTS